MGLCSLVSEASGEDSNGWGHLQLLGAGDDLQTTVSLLVCLAAGLGLAETVVQLPTCGFSSMEVSGSLDFLHGGSRLQEQVNVLWGEAGAV